MLNQLQAQLTKSIIALQILAFVSICSISSHASESCSSSFDSGLDGQWRITQGTMFDALRANAPHMMKAVVDESSNSALVALKDFKGVVIGDFHLLNLADIELVEHMREIGVVDIDDGGVNSPLIADTVRALIGANISGFGISLNDALSAYLRGLNLQPQKSSTIVRTALEASEDDFLSKQKDWIDKITSNGLFNEKSKVLNISEADDNVQNLFQNVKTVLIAALDGKKVLDFGYRKKDGGGSQGLPRFWFLVENKAMPKKMEAIEFKFEGRPASDLAFTQPDHTQRIAAVISEFRPSRPVYGVYKVVKTPAGSFLARTRLKNEINIDLSADFSESEKRDIAELYLYYIYLLGADHGKQLAKSNTKLAFQKILSNPESVQSLLDWCKDYELKMRQLNVGQN